MRSPNGDLSFLAMVGQKWKLPNGEKSKAFDIKIGRLVSHVEHYATFIFFIVVSVSILVTVACILAG